MPYNIKKVKTKYHIIRKEDGKVVGKSDTLAKARASVAHRMKND